MSKKDLKVVVGLGNYGDKYAYTFHNMGFMVVDCLGDRFGLDFKLKPKLHCRMAEFVDGECGKVVLAQPWTYMNLSGVCVKSLLSWYNVDLNDLIVVYDDIDIELGTIRARSKGSAGTHNGMRNTITMLDSTDFARIRVGIGAPPPDTSLVDWVTSTIPKDQRHTIAQGIENAADSVQKWLQGKLFGN